MENSAVLSAQHMNLYYGTFQALKDVSLTMDEHAVTALIGPSGCGKSTFIKTLNRMNDLIPGVRVEGTILYRGRDIFDKDLDVTLLRKRIGMVFQKPNPFPMTVYDNVAYGPRLHGVRGKKELDAIVEEALRGAAIWDKTAFFLLGELVEAGPTEKLFNTPSDKRTEDYITGRFG